MQRINDFLQTQSKWQLAEHTFVTLVVLYGAKQLCSGKGLVHNVGKTMLSFVKHVPFAGAALQSTLDEEAKKAVDEMANKKTNQASISALPKQGLSEEELLAKLDEMKQLDLDPSQGRVFAYVYDAGKKHNQIVAKASDMFLHSNALNPMVFSSLRKMEIEIVRMAVSMFHGDPAVSTGSVSSGGTESLALAVKTYRDRARALFNIQDPEIVMCVTGHPAINKACHSYNVKVVQVSCDSKTKRMNIEEVKKAINKNTIAVFASAPQYPHGMVDPIEEIAAITKKHNIGLHVDSCIGGFMLPWVRKLNPSVPKFDFEIDGVTSISADMHKYGFGAKGASVVLYKDASLRRYQFYAYSLWPGGLYISPTVLGTRGGGPIAAAWASLMSLGEDGFLRIAKETMETVQYIKNGVAQTKELELVGEPHMTIVAIQVKPEFGKLNIHSIADAMEERGWKLERQQFPDCIHLTVMPQHAATRDQFVTDLKWAIEQVKQDPAKYAKGAAAMYGLLAKIPDDAVIDEFLLSFMGHIYK